MKSLLDDCPNWCMSGGAEGADLAWGEAARKANHGVIHYSFDGHRTRARQDEVVILTPAQLAEADPFCRQANAHLGRHFPPRSEFVANLLRRDYFQVKDASRLYAVSAIDHKGMVAGGTAWAVMMFLVKHSLLPCGAFVFDQERGSWFTWEGHWEPVGRPPTPSGIYAGVGTRRLGRRGRDAIDAVFMVSSDAPL